MKDISILACFGIKTDELENYQIEDLSPTAISLSVTKRRNIVGCLNCGDTNLYIKDYKNNDGADDHRLRRRPVYG